MNEPANKPEWEQIERVMGHALELPEGQRAVYLERQPASIRAEVESLLSAYRRSSNFLGNETDAQRSAPSAQRLMEVDPGTQLGPYRLDAVIGQGGMGVVYRALDTKLNRPVAVKFLFEDLAKPAARRRFQREAQMASSLNHPHILTVHDAGDFEGRQYLVTEFIDGGTLKDWARAEKRTWQEAVELLAGVADGLATAHAAGILHRDIKPANILVGRNGYAKLVDFGLAKLEKRSAPDALTRTVLSDDSRPGMILGTIAYMSPEQASGRPVDARSDIFSFGAVLYELLAGRRPFEGDTDLQVLQTIIHGRPRPVGDEIPAALRVVVEKALEKEPADRYQSMREMVVDLRRLTRQSAETPAPPVRRPARLFTWVIASSLLLMALFAAGVLVLFRARESALPAHLQYIPLTNFADSATSPALSPDGRMLAFIRGESTFYGPGQICVKLLPDGEVVQLTDDNLDKMSPKFSRDGARIAYTTQHGSTWDTWVVPVLGGKPRLFLSNAEGLTWIDGGPNQRHILFSEMTGRGLQMPIVTSTESRAQQRTIYMPPETGMAHRSYLSPDLKWVLVVEMDMGTWLPCRVIPFDGSSRGKPVGPSPAQCTDAAWSPDGKWMYFSADIGNGYHIWRQRFPDGAPEQFTSGVTQEEGIEFAPDGRSFVTSIGTSQSTVWLHNSGAERQITSEGFAVLPNISPDGKKMYYLLRSGAARMFLTGELWVADLESGQRQRLLPDFLLRHYNISADGRRIVFVAADGTGRTPVWVATLDGSSAPRRVTTDDAWTAFFGASGHIVFAGDEEGAHYVYRVKEDGSELHKIVPVPVPRFFSVSPDGRWVAVGSSAEETRYGVLLYPVGGGSPTVICPSCWHEHGIERGPAPPVVAWSPDGKLLYLYFEGSTYAIPLRPGQVLPPIPTLGLRSKADLAAVPGVRLIGERAFAGPTPSVSAFTKFSIQRNIYRVPVP
jgi:serine/threonine protein kinase/Tol biopolymer transport system component